MRTIKEVQTKFEVFWITNDIVCFKYQSDVIIEKGDIIEMLQIHEQIGANESTKRLVHAGRFTTITAEAREYIEQHNLSLKAEAFVLSGLPQRILFNFYIEARKNKHPIKSFKSLQPAIK